MDTVIPGRRAEARSAKAGEPGIQKHTRALLVAGFRVPAFGRPRNDSYQCLIPGTLSF
jgi:hypothetical protein